MTTCHLMHSSGPHSNLLNFEHPDRRAAANTDRELARQETELREALAKVQALRRLYDERTRPPEGGMLAARESAGCRIATLTPREHEVLELVVAGRPSKIIAWELGISQRTVENHRASIMHKTGSKSIAALAQLAMAAAWDMTDGPIDHAEVPLASAAGWR